MQQIHDLQNNTDILCYYTTANLDLYVIELMMLGVDKILL